MFDIGFSELILIFVIGLVVLGPQRLPIAIRTVVGWIRTIRGMATHVQNELSQELKLNELQESIRKAEHLNLSELSPELAKNIEDLKLSAEEMQKQINEQKDGINSALNERISNNIDSSLYEDERAELAEENDPNIEVIESSSVEDNDKKVMEHLKRYQGEEIPAEAEEYIHLPDSAKTSNKNTD